MALSGDRNRMFGWDEEQLGRLYDSMVGTAIRALLELPEHEILKAKSWFDKDQDRGSDAALATMPQELNRIIQKHKASTMRHYLDDPKFSFRTPHGELVDLFHQLAAVLHMLALDPSQDEEWRQAASTGCNAALESLSKLGENQHYAYIGELPKNTEDHLDSATSLLTNMALLADPMFASFTSDGGDSAWYIDKFSEIRTSIATLVRLTR